MDAFSGRKIPGLRVFALCLGILAGSNLGTRAAVLAGPIVNPANGHSYYLLTANTWTASEAEAVVLGGHLVTINDQAENHWVYNHFINFGGVQRGLWIGLTDQAAEGTWRWSSGQPVNFTSWITGEPNNNTKYGPQNWAMMWPPAVEGLASPYAAEKWNDYWDYADIIDASLVSLALRINGVVEVETPVVTPAFKVAYTQDFEGAVGAEWSNRKVSTTPAGARRFLGNFGNQATRLTLTNLPAHSAAEVSFDLYLIQSWDGNNGYFGPDQWDLQVVGGAKLIHTTFGHGQPDNYIYPDGQAYPGDYPGGRFRLFTGATETDTLGYTFGNLGIMNSVYEQTYGFSHAGDTLQLDFSASNLQALSDESWGIDNVSVRLIDAPAGLLQFRRPFFGAAEDGTNAVLTVERVGGSAGAVSAQIVVTDDTARLGTDYLAPAATISFADGETQKTLLIPLVNDDVPEPDKDFVVALVQPAGGALLGSQARAVVLLEDDDSTIQFASTNFTAAEIDPNARVTATRSGWTNSVAVARAKTFVTSGPDAATSGADFTPNEVRLVFQKGILSQAASIGIQDDALVEADETFGFRLSSPFGARLNQLADTRVMILDNDTATGPGRGVNGQVQDLVVQPNGQILIAGGFDQVNAVSRPAIARLNPDGSLDSAFNPAGGADNQIETMALQNDGSILIGGSFANYNATARARIARVTAAGSLDATFDPGAGANNTVYKVLLQKDGKILLAGAFTTVAGTARNRIARLNANGTLDRTFDPGTGADNTILGAGLQNDGKIIVSGPFGTFNGAARLRFARLNPDGSLDNTFNVGSGANGRANAMLFQADGKVIMGGLFTTYNGTTRNRVMRLNSNGSVDATFDVGSGPNSTVWEMAFQPDGKILVAGEFSTWNGANHAGIVRLNADGTLDNSFAVGFGAAGYVGAVAALPDGRIALGGNFTLVDGFLRARFAFLNADASQEPEPLDWVSGPAAEGGEPHFYALTSRAEDWEQAEAEAVAQGGHLATINSDAEQNFLTATFLRGLNRTRPFWIGFNDAAVEGKFIWSSGEPVNYTAWDFGEPNNRNNEDYTVLNWSFSENRGTTPGTFGLWNDVMLRGSYALSSSDGPYFGIMEINASAKTPVISRPPASAIVLAGTDVELSVEARSEGAVSYSWQRADQPIVGATGAVLKLPQVTAADSDSYRVVVSNAFGQTISAPATLLVVTAPRLDPNRLLVTGNNGATLKVNVPAGIHLVLEKSSDLRTWETLLETTATEPELTLADPQTVAARFYRLKYIMP